MDQSPRPKQRPKLKLSYNDLMKIERVVNAEAKGEGVEGRNAVRGVIFNRLMSDRFPNTVDEVLSAKEFEPVRKYGSIDKIPVDENALNEQLTEMADYIQLGEDASKGSTFFLNKKLSKKRGTDFGGESPMVIGNHTFYKGYKGQEPVTDVSFSHDIELDYQGYDEGGMVSKFMDNTYEAIPAPVPTKNDLDRAKSRARLEAADRLGYFIPPEIKDFGRKAFNFASAVDPVQGIMRGMSASGRAFDEDLPDDERRQAAIEASLETLAPLGLVGVGTLAKQPAKNILLDVLTPTGAPSSMADDAVFDPGRRKFLKQSLAAAGTAAVAPDILSDLGTKATKVVSKSIGNIDAAVAKLLNTRKNSSALIERGLDIEYNLRRKTSTPKPPKDNKLLLSKDYADKLTLEDEFKKELASSGNKPQKEIDDLYRQASLLDNEADNMANEILKTVGDNPEVLPTLESQTIEDLIGSFNINERMSAAQETDAYMALVEEAIRRGMHKDYEKYPMTDLAAEYTLQDIKSGNTTGMVDLRNIDLNVSPATKKETAPRVIKEGVSPQEALELTDEQIELFRRSALEGGRGTSEAFRKALKGRDEELTDLANQLKDGKITVRMYRQAADRIRPIRELNSVPEPATFREVVSALDAGKRKKPIVGLNTTLSEGDEITARLDINAYTDYDVWVPTLTHNKQTMYKPTVVMRNVEFIQPDSPAVKKALNVAAGQAKAPFAVMKGNYVDIDDYDAFSLAKENFKSEEWIQVGYDPTKRGYFYDRSTGEPVLNAEEVIQVGSLVLAKNATKGSADAFAFNEGGMAMGEQMNAVFKSSRTGYAEGGEVGEAPDNTIGVDPVSGNDVPSGSLPEEVRDDVPAMLSEGEYVVPADVVRYYGVKFFEDLRTQAKSGWSDMEANGRIGGSPIDQESNGMEMIEPEDDLPFDVGELQVVDSYEMNEGGIVGYAEGGFDPRNPFRTSKSMSGVFEIKEYINDDGEIMYIQFLNGNPMTFIPRGFRPKEAPAESLAEEVQDSTPTAEPVAQSSSSSSNDRSGGDDSGSSTTNMTEGESAKDWKTEDIDSISRAVKGLGRGSKILPALAGKVNPLLGVAAGIGMGSSSRNTAYDILDGISYQLENQNLSDAQKAEFLKQQAAVQKYLEPSSKNDSIATSMLKGTGIFGKQSSMYENLDDTSGDGRRTFADTWLGDLLGLDGSWGVDGYGLSESLGGARRTGTFNDLGSDAANKRAAERYRGTEEDRALAKEMGITAAELIEQRKAEPKSQSQAAYNAATAEEQTAMSSAAEDTLMSQTASSSSGGSGSLVTGGSDDPSWTQTQIDKETAGGPYDLSTLDWYTGNTSSSSSSNNDTSSSSSGSSWDNTVQAVKDDWNAVKSWLGFEEGGYVDTKQKGLMSKK